MHLKRDSNTYVCKETPSLSACRFLLVFIIFETYILFLNPVGCCCGIIFPMLPFFLLVFLSSCWAKSIVTLMLNCVRHFAHSLKCDMATNGGLATFCQMQSCEPVLHGLAYLMNSQSMNCWANTLGMSAMVLAFDTYSEVLTSFTLLEPDSGYLEN